MSIAEPERQAEVFDPYHKWLGIPAEEQPADHYRLLGIRRFEKDPDVIESAADRQMAHLRTFQTGKRAVECQRLLNEVSSARGCLLDPQRKTEYDNQLKFAVTEPPPIDENRGKLRVVVDEGGNAVSKPAQPNYASVADYDFTGAAALANNNEQHSPVVSRPANDERLNTNTEVTIMTDNGDGTFSGVKGREKRKGVTKQPLSLKAKIAMVGTAIGTITVITIGLIATKVFGTSSAQPLAQNNVNAAVRPEDFYETDTGEEPTIGGGDPPDDEDETVTDPSTMRLNNLPDDDQVTANDDENNRPKPHPPKPNPPKPQVKPKPNGTFVVQVDSISPAAVEVIRREMEEDTFKDEYNAIDNAADAESLRNAVQNLIDAIQKAARNNPTNAEQKAFAMEKWSECVDAGQFDLAQQQLEEIKQMQQQGFFGATEVDNLVEDLQNEMGESTNHEAVFDLVDSLVESGDMDADAAYDCKVKSALAAYKANPKDGKLAAKLLDLAEQGASEAEGDDAKSEIEAAKNLFTKANVAATAGLRGTERGDFKKGSDAVKVLIDLHGERVEQEGNLPNQEAVNQLTLIHLKLGEINEDYMGKCSYPFAVAFNTPANTANEYMARAKAKATWIAKMGVLGPTAIETLNASASADYQTALDMNDTDAADSDPNRLSGRDVTAAKKFINAHEPKEDTVVDNSGGSDSGTDTNEEPKKDTSYVKFNGRGTVVTPCYYDGSHPLTVEVTAKPDKVGGVTGVIGNMHASGFGIELWNGKWQFLVHNGTDYVVARSPHNADYENSSDVVGVFDGKTVSLFVDGEKVASAPFNGKHNASKHPVFVGADPDENGKPQKFFHGTVYRASASNVSRIEAGENGGNDTVKNGKVDANTSFAYEFDDAKGRGIVKDDSKNKNNGRTFGEVNFAESEKRTARKR